MANYFYIENEEKKARQSQLYWLFFIVSFSLVIIGLLVIINTETNFLADFEKNNPGFSREKKLGIEKRLLGNWAIKELGIEKREEIEKVLANDSVTSKHPLSSEEKSSIEERLKKKL